jgi:hypothetical protein
VYCNGRVISSKLYELVSLLHAGNNADHSGIRHKLSSPAPTL